MSSSFVHYRFKTTKDEWKTIQFDGSVINKDDVIHQIVKDSYKRSRDVHGRELEPDCNFQLFTDGSLQTQHKQLIPKNSTIVVVRQPNIARPIFLPMTETQKSGTSKSKALGSTSSSSHVTGSAYSKPEPS